jgi:hypothetical protein
MTRYHERSELLQLGLNRCPLEFFRFHLANQVPTTEVGSSLIRSYVSHSRRYQHGVCKSFGCRIAATRYPRRRRSRAGQDLLEHSRVRFQVRGQIDEIPHSHDDVYQVDLITGGFCSRIKYVGENWMAEAIRPWRLVPPPSAHARVAPTVQALRAWHPPQRAWRDRVEYPGNLPKNAWRAQFPGVKECRCNPRDSRIGLHTMRNCRDNPL